MTAGCFNCGAALVISYQRGPWSVVERPASVYYDGSDLKLSPQQAAILAVLVRVGLATCDELADACSDRNTLKVQVHGIRAKLPAGVTLASGGYRTHSYQLCEPG